MLKIALAALGTTVFTVLPNVLAEESGQSDFLAGISKSVGGVILVFLGHWVISLLIKDVLLNIQYKSYLKRLNDNSANSNQSLGYVFSISQVNFLKSVEETSSKTPSFFLIIFSLIASLAYFL